MIARIDFAQVRLLIVLLLAACITAPKVTPSVAPSNPSETAPARQTLAPSATPQPAKTKSPPTQPSTPARDSLAIAPYPDAPLCPDSGELHDNSLFHTLWDGARDCHYDHEHGQDPFAPEVAATFPGFDLQALIGGVGVGHTNPSSPVENVAKHGGFKWDVTLSHSAGCTGREGVPTGVDALVSQYHAFGDYSIEFEARVHSALALMRQCQAGNPTDYGYIFVIQHQDYGQRVAPYQGSILPYPDTPLSAYDSAREPYLTIDCFGGIPPCVKYPTLDFILSHHASANSTWISEPGNLAGSGSNLFSLLFRVRDNFQVLDWHDQTYPLTFRWLCSADGGLSYAAIAGCPYNNSTTRVQEVAGEIPAAWDNLAGFDTDKRVGRITAEAYVTRFGDLAPACRPGAECFPIKMVQAFTGRYGSQFVMSSDLMPSRPPNLPERDIYFCRGQVCAEGEPGSVSSGWIGREN